MRSMTWTMTGVAAVAAGILMLGYAYGTSGVVHAGGQQKCNGTVIPEDIQAFQRLPECSPTPRKLRTHTPTATPTESPRTATPVPPTAAPTNTPKAASEGVAVKPPSTGSGDGRPGGDLGLWLLGFGAVAVALGGGAVAVGVRRR